jgi:ferredoxin
MKVIVNVDVCVGHGQCEEIAPEVFTVNDDAIVELLKSSPPEDLWPRVEEAVRRCPANVISIER